MVSSVLYNLRIISFPTLLLQIQPSQLPGEQNLVSHVYLEVVSKHFSKSKKMPLTYDNGFLFIHTDKPVYTPDQSGRVQSPSLWGNWHYTLEHFDIWN